MNVQIRKAGTKDVALLQQLNQEVFIDNHQYDDDLMMDWALSKEGGNYFLRIVSESKSVCFIAEIESKAVGYISGATKTRVHRKSLYFEIDNVGVMPSYRSKGIGTLLVTKIKEWAKENNHQKLYVNSYFHNTRAVEFYKRHGFSEIDVSLEMKI